MRSQAHVVGDIHHQSLSIEGGAYFDGRSKQTRAAKGPELDKLARKLLREIARKEAGRERLPKGRQLDGAHGADAANPKSVRPRKALRTAFRRTENGAAASWCPELVHDILFLKSDQSVNPCRGMS